MVTLQDDQRKSLEKLRDQIIAAAPGCEAHFGYRLPGFKLNGRPLVHTGTGRNGCVLYGSVPSYLSVQPKYFKPSKGREGVEVCDLP